ncbi:MAG TPA: hypothetical protein VIQ98_09530, partial [Gemmatimonadales bacterium]
MKVLRCAVLTACILFAPRASLFAQKQPLSFEKFIALETASDPRPSPDGAMVAYGVSVPSLQENRNISRIWLVPAAGGTARMLTRGPGSDRAPRWSPDGRWVAFISTRGGSPQVWRVAPA